MKHLPVLCRNAYFAPSVSRQLGSGHEPDLEQSVRFNQRRQDEINMFSRNHLSFSTLFLDKPRICIDIYILNIYYILITIYIYTICVDCLFRGYQQTVKKRTCAAAIAHVCQVFLSIRTEHLPVASCQKDCFATCPIEMLMHFFSVQQTDAFKTGRHDQE